MIYQRRLRTSVVVVIFLIILMGAGWFNRESLAEWWRTRNAPAVPEAVDKDSVVREDPLDTIGPINANVAIETELVPPPVPEEFNLAMSFTPQAPHANWNLPYQEACEEASAAMVHYYWADLEFTSPELSDQEILKLVDFQTEQYGFYKDTTAEETARFMRDYYGYENIEVVYDPTVEQIKAVVASGYPVMVPAYGKALANPYFRSGGPLYHMLVIKGYTADTFITNDPGTRRGADFVYPIENVMTAMGDWNDGDPESGRKVMIVVRGA